MGIYLNFRNNFDFVLQGQGLTLAVTARDGVCNGYIFRLLWPSWLSVLQEQSMKSCIQVFTTQTPPTGPWE